MIYTTQECGKKGYKYYSRHYSILGCMAQLEVSSEDNVLIGGQEYLKTGL